MRNKILIHYLITIPSDKKSTFFEFLYRDIQINFNRQIHENMLTENSFESKNSLIQ